MIVELMRHLEVIGILQAYEVLRNTGSGDHEGLGGNESL